MPKTQQETDKTFKNYEDKHGFSSKHGINCLNKMQCFDVLWKREGIPYSIAIIQFAEHFAERKLFLWGKSLFELSPIAFDRSWWSWSPPSSNKYKRQSNLLIWHHPWPWPKPWQWSKSNCDVFMAIYGGSGSFFKIYL